MLLTMGGGYDAEQLKYISEVLGTTGIITSGMRYEKETVLPFQLHKDYSENTGEGKRQLMTTDEIRRLEKGKLILVKQDDKPVKLDMSSS